MKISFNAEMQYEVSQEDARKNTKDAIDELKKSGQNFILESIGITDDSSYEDMIVMIIKRTLRALDDSDKIITIDNLKID